MFAEPPPAAAWRHRDARAGFEVLRSTRTGGGWTLHGVTTAVEDGTPWAVEYVIDVDDDWHTRGAEIVHPIEGRRVSLRRDGPGRWLVDGLHVPELDGCLDVDLESSAMTNALPVHRLRLAVDETADAPAAYVRAADLTVSRLDQTYRRLPDAERHQRYYYDAPAFDYTACLVYDETGFVLEYPGLAVRV
ncbi:hypothetical protein ETD83_23195 [Actinomadura soli]|uniref:Glycolipid-binding domain-containing protein n=1 Tax=Actinomadura soli TaxID=2508997 RepID=A0A5C4J8E9_9ACTN|nr:putative glycolipid-binding domain-containing protein [Actinomadura soli]TMQ94922.1 hypothetical protein ETD83_23195 [Actinomadura soli]